MKHFFVHLRLFLSVILLAVFFFSCGYGSDGSDDLRERRERRIQERSPLDRSSDTFDSESFEGIQGASEAMGEQGVTPSPEETSARLINSGRAAIDRGDAQAAINYFSQAVDMDVNASVAYYNRAVVYRNLEQYEKALNDYNKAIELDQKYVDAYTGRGVTRYLQEKFEEAIKNYNIAISLDSGYAGAFYNRGIARYRMQDMEAACNDWRQANHLGFPQAADVVKQFCQ